MKELSEKGHELLEQLEGFRSKPYLDQGGVPTIGFGSTYYPDGRRVKMTDPPLTQEQAKKLKQKVLRKFSKAVNKYATTRINQNQFDALVCFAYNVGVDAFQNSTLLFEVNKDPNNFDAINKQFRRWIRVKGEVNKGLINRREKELKHYGTP